jgi:hypothetical protein
MYLKDCFRRKIKAGINTGDYPKKSCKLLAAGCKLQVLGLNPLRILAPEADSPQKKKTRFC